MVRLVVVGQWPLLMAAVVSCDAVVALEVAVVVARSRRNQW